MVVRHRGKIEKGEVRFANREAFKTDLLKFKPDAEIVVTVEEYKNTRSQNQNRYYWGVVIKILSDELGYFPEEIHEVLKQKFLRYKNIQVGQERFSVGGSTTDLKTNEFEDYLAQVRAWASAELEINIPEPNEITY